MAIDAMKLEELDRIKKVQVRLDALDVKLNEVFAAYNIPADITDRDAKLSYALSEIGDDQVARKELRDKNDAAQKDFDLASVSIQEDFVNMVDLGNKRIKIQEQKIKIAEVEFGKQKLQEETKKSEIVAIDEAVAEINAEKAEIQAKITEGKSNSVKAKDEAKELAKKIAEAEARITEIDTEIEKLNEANRNTNDPDELKNNAEKIASLQGEKTTLIQNRSELSVQHQDKETEKSGYEENIRKLKGDFLGLDSQVNDLTSRKTFLENELRLMPIAADELKKSREAFDKQKEEFSKTVKDMEKVLKERGIDIKSKMPEEPDKDKDKNKTPIVPGNGGNYGGGNGGGTPVPNTSLPVVTPEQKKRKNFEYITGYTDNGIGLSSNDRLKRIQSELGGRDYEAMVKSFEELKNSPVKLTRDEKKKIKEMMKVDKENVARTVKEVDIGSLDKLFRSVGIQLDPADLKSLHKNYGESTYGMLDGFTQMSSDNQSKFADAIKGYGMQKEDMSEEDRKAFETYILTPVKFGTLQAQTNEVCRNPLTRFIAKFQGESRKVSDIRAAIAEVEVPEGEEISSTTRARDFAETLRNQTEPNPPLNERNNRSDNERNRNGR